jgi:purine-binding chemotaxis protein CheW
VPDQPSPKSYLIARAGSKQLAIELADVVEVMRPLPISALEGAPAFVLGASVVRGTAVPVVDARALLGEEPGPTACGRFISLRLRARRAVLAVDGLGGVRALEDTVLKAMPPLLGGVAAGVAEMIGTLDHQLLLVLGAGRILPEAAWNAIGAADRP